jgi:hypothetical protein
VLTEIGLGLSPFMGQTPHRVAGPAHVPRPGQHRFMHSPGDRPALRARGCGRMIGDRPYLQRAVCPGPRIGDLQAIHAEQHRRRILEHDARGFLMILKSLVRPKIVKAAGSLFMAARRTHTGSREPARVRYPARSVTSFRHSKTSGSDTWS